jgi:hypothetical protein
MLASRVLAPFGISAFWWLARWASRIGSGDLDAIVDQPSHEAMTAIAGTVGHTGAQQ